jgi:hypothetical protein
VVLNNKDAKIMRQAKQDIGLKLMPTPVTVQYGRHQVQQLDIYSKFKNHTLWVWSEIFGYAR